MEGMWKMEVALIRLQWVGAGWKTLEEVGVWKMGIREEGHGRPKKGRTKWGGRELGSGECTRRERADSQRGESDVVEGGDVGVVAEDVFQALSSGKEVSAFFVCKRSKTMSPSKLGGNGDEK